MYGNNDTRKMWTEMYLGQRDNETRKCTNAVEILAAHNDPYGFWAIESEKAWKRRARRKGRVKRTNRNV